MQACGNWKTVVFLSVNIPVQKGLPLSVNKTYEQRVWCQNERKTSSSVFEKGIFLMSEMWKK